MSEKMDVFLELIDETYRRGWRDALTTIRKVAFDRHNDHLTPPIDIIEAVIAHFEAEAAEPPAPEITHQEPPQAQPDPVQPHAPPVVRPTAPPRPAISKSKAKRIPSTNMLGTLEPSGYRPPEGVVKRVLLDDRPVMDQGAFTTRGGAGAHDNSYSSKRDLTEIMREAAANTAPKGGEDDGD